MWEEEPGLEGRLGIWVDSERGSVQWGVASLEGSGDRCCLPVYLSTWLAG